MSKSSKKGKNAAYCCSLSHKNEENSINCHSDESTDWKTRRKSLIDRYRDEKGILLKNSELQTCLKLYYQKCKGVGARKIYSTISKVFCGITEREVQTYINRLQMHQQLHPTFINKQPLNPVKSSSVMAQVQMDLVDMQNISVQNDANPFRYVLVILDVFSRYIFYGHSNQNHHVKFRPMFCNSLAM